MIEERDYTQAKQPANDAAVRLLSTEGNTRVTLQQLGLCGNYTGYNYLLMAVDLALQGIEVGKPLYAMIASKHHAKYNTIRQDIYTCIHRAQRSNPDLYSRITGHSPQVGAFATSSFITCLAQWVRTYDAYLVCDDGHLPRPVWQKKA
ncbi:MAG: sporulation initiation factor Spo0A C-terminal domain-containing protein [Oscillospiraceae bacterium]|nr:sporulation initiation factor Spo0A C-terminal domain-containing protein [Oscillospiraceae bacterium]